MFGPAGHDIGEEFSVYTYRKPCGFTSCDAQDPVSVCWAVFFCEATSLGQGAAVGPGLRGHLAKGKVDKKQIFKSGGPNLLPAGV